MADSAIENRELFSITDAVARLDSSLCTIRQVDRAMHDLISHYERAETTEADRKIIFETLERQARMGNIRPGVFRHMEDVPSLFTEGSWLLSFKLAQHKAHDDKKRRRDLRERDQTNRLMEARGIKVHGLRERN